MGKIIKIAILLGLLWVGYNVAYQTPEQKKMKEAYTTQPKTNQFFDGFEKASSISDLFPQDYSRWHEVIVQNNEKKIRRPIKYCMLGVYNCTMDENQNHFEIQNENTFRGRNALKFTVHPFKRQWFGDSKVAIRRQLFDFKEGDDFYFSGWFYFEGPEDSVQNLKGLSFLAIRSPHHSLRYLGEPGRRLFFEGQNYIYSDLDNWMPKAKLFSQDLMEQISVPRNKWVNIRVKMKLSGTTSGQMEVWQNDRKLIHHKGRTLPTPSSVYNILEIGGTGNTNETNIQTLYVDDIWVSKSGFPNQ